MVIQTAFTEVSRASRVLRSPQHTFNLKHKPWQIQPFCIAPVLPGETLKNLLLQARVVTDPIKNPLIGWWCEHYFFYVKHRDLAARETLVNMMLDPNADVSAIKTSTANHKHYFYSASGTMINWVDMCLEVVTEEFFRNEGEAYLAAAVDSLPLASVNQNTWLDSVMNHSDYNAPAEQSVDANADTIITPSEVHTALRNWQWLRLNNLTNMTYEDYLKSYGVSVPEPEEQFRPELIRYLREWTYPTNTIDPTNGTPRSACSWSVQERADKDRYFKEPGFIFGVTVVRPKVYMVKQYCPAVCLMDSALAWLPAVLSDDPYNSLKKVTAGTGPLADNVQAYWVDIKDIFLHGDQFRNYAYTETGVNQVSLPSNAMAKRYVSSTDIDNLFVTSTVNQVKQDGVVSLKILGRQTETSATH